MRHHEAFGVQPLIVERDAQRIVGAQRCPFGRRRILDLELRLETPSAFALEGISLALEPLKLR